MTDVVEKLLRNRDYQRRRQVEGRQRIADRKYRGLPVPTRPAPCGCEICGAPPKRNELCLDHDHETGKFRGWLCVPCNAILGRWGDNLAGVMKAVAYLKRAQES